MRITVDRKAFVDELAFCASVIPNQHVIPLLAHVRMDLLNGNLHLAATDLQITVTTTCPAEILRDGDFTIEAKPLLDAVKSAESDTITLEHDAERERLTVQAGSATFKLPHTSKLDLYPTLPALDGDTSYTILTSVLRDVLAAVSYCTDSIETRFQLNGVLASVSRRGTEFAAMNGFQVAASSIESIHSSREFKMFLPMRLVAAWLKHGNGEDTTLKYDDPRVQLSSGNRMFTHIGMDVNFPNYRASIPDDLSRVARIETTRLSALVSRVLRFTTTSKRIFVALTKGRLTATVQNEDLGDASDWMAIDYGGEDITFAMPGGRLVNTLKAIHTQTVAMNFSDDPQRPVTFVPDDDEQDTLHLLCTMAQ